MRLYILLTSLLLITACAKKDFNKEITVYPTYEAMAEYIAADPSPIKLINFWATTCPPCLKEMPHLDHLASEQSDQIKVFLVSLDEARHHESRVIPFVQKHQIKSEVLHLTDENYSAWTEKIDSSWMGALPATLIQSDGNRQFKFGAYTTYEELLADIERVQ